MSRHHDIARAVADLVATKQIAYGDSFGRSGEILRILYPAGVPPERLHDVLVVARVIDKLFRIATANDPGGESPWQDVCGYGLLALARQQQEAGHEVSHGAGSCGATPDQSGAGVCVPADDAAREDRALHPSE